MCAELQLLEGSYAVIRLASDATPPSWLTGSGFSSFSRSDEDVSIVCRADRVPGDVEADRGWVCFKSVEAVGLDEPGFVLSVIRPLSENGIGTFVTSTFRGDHFMVKEDQLWRARSLLRAAGHSVFPTQIHPETPADRERSMPQAWNIKDA